jgi:hypothetical protein
VKNLIESGEKEDSGMEVMDIESDNEEPNLATPPNAFTAPAKSTPPTQHRPLSTKESEKEPKKKEPSVTLLTNSESLKGGDSKSVQEARPSQLPTPSFAYHT